MDESGLLEDLEEDVPRLYKSTIVIWSDFNPEEVDSDFVITDLVDAAVSGDAQFASFKSTMIENPVADPDWIRSGLFAGMEA